jgi:hypothetical protein
VNGRPKTMAKMTGIQFLEQRIEKAKIDVVRTKQKYDEAVAKLGDLMDKRDGIRRDELVKIIMKSNKSYDEIIRFLNDEDADDE